MSAPRVPGRRGVMLELAAIAGLAAAFLGSFRGRPGYVDVALGLVAVALIAASTSRSRAIWGRTHAPAAPTDAARSPWLPIAIFTSLGVAAFLAVGLYRGYAAGGAAGALGRIANWHLLLAAAFYFPWALLQQFVFQFYLLGRLLSLLPYAAAVAVTGIAFSAVHFPRVPVMIGTMVAGIFWAASYSRHRRLLPLAVSHAVLGSTLHYWVFGRDLAAIWGLR